METRQRTVVKAVLWSVLGWIIMALVGLTCTGSLTTSGTMAAINTALGLLSYVIYERIWTNIAWGRA
ncbi:DUF2061 domain-containing protein [Pseudoruegeria sp. HB172150]|uniref:DUF2061 domain-containing protein n=1 Tax=Pseudoruegeria sp. HB172150 TaxID=2721164 RepID=UPI0015555A7E|nr:DUF2061 domain-containing protein [Pseudoruegeria sp. HB172150]